jgi:SNF2 family DNA or RNA helicase
MSLTDEQLSRLCVRLSLGKDHQAQERTVRSALTSLLVDGRKGVVLADEVGFGKTYEALAIMALLCERDRAARKSFDRVLILCKSVLLAKWEEELSRVQSKRAFDNTWSARNGRHGIQSLASSTPCML